jgi:hypothetical protein
MMPMPGARKPLKLEKVENHRCLRPLEKFIPVTHAAHHSRVSFGARILARY